MLAQINIKDQDLTTLVEPEAALARGSSFTNLYKPYKFETNKILKGSTPRQNLLALIDIYSFIVHDLNLYQDTHPNCKRTKTILNTFKSELSKIKDYYNTNYTPLTICDLSPNGNYIEGPWPWEDRF